MVWLGGLPGGGEGGVQGRGTDGEDGYPEAAEGVHCLEVKGVMRLGRCG